MFGRIDRLGVQEGNLFFWSRLLPRTEIETLFHNPGISSFPSREFAFFPFESSNPPLRFRSFSNIGELVNRIKTEYGDFGSVHVGGTYDIGSSSVTTLKGLSCLGSELRFDYDADDADCLRGCCRNKKTVCVLCWPMCVIMAQVIEYILRTVFDMQCILHVFSGRRGIHTWVFDNKALQMKSEKRQDVLSVFEMISEWRKDMLCLQNFREPNNKKGQDAMFRFFSGLSEHVLLPGLRRIVEKDVPLFYWSTENMFSINERKWGGFKGSTTAMGVDILVIACDIPEMVKQGDMALTDKLCMLEMTLRGMASRDVPTSRMIEHVKQIIMNESDTSGRSPEEKWREVELRLAFMLVFDLDASITRRSDHLLKIMTAPNWKAEGTLCLPFDPTEEMYQSPLAFPNITDVYNEKKEAIEAFNHSMEILKNFVLQLKVHRITSFPVPHKEKKWSFDATRVNRSPSVHRKNV